MDAVLPQLLQLAEHQPWLVGGLACAALIFVKMFFAFMVRLVRGYEPGKTMYCPACNCERCRKLTAVSGGESIKAGI